MISLHRCFPLSPPTNLTLLLTTHYPRFGQTTPLETFCNENFVVFLPFGFVFQISITFYYFHLCLRCKHVMYDVQTKSPAKCTAEWSNWDQSGASVRNYYGPISEIAYHNIECNNITILNVTISYWSHCPQKVQKYSFDSMDAS